MYENYYSLEELLAELKGEISRLSVFLSYVECIQKDLYAFQKQYKNDDKMKAKIIKLTNAVRKTYKCLKRNGGRTRDAVIKELWEGIEV